MAVKRNTEAETYFKKSLNTTFCASRGDSVIIKDTVKKGLYIFGRVRDSFLNSEKGILIVRGKGEK